MNNNKLAKILLAQSMTPDAMIDATRVTAVCDYVEKELPTTRCVPVLREYLRLLKSAINAETSLIETSADVSPETLESLKAFAQAQAGRKLRFEHKIDQNLLGGVRLSFGDNVVENSVKSQLEEMK